MVSELNMTAKGFAPLQTTSGYAPASVSDSAGQALPGVTGKESNKSGGDEKVSINSASGSYAALDGGKEVATQSAQAVREAGKGLDKAEDILKKMAEAVDAVKNYPPFPAGNEDREKYLKSIDGLRKELQSMVIPPASADFQPVFYPQKDKFPPLDQKFPSEAAVLAFGKAVEAIQSDVKTARQALEAQAKQIASAEAAAGLPRPVDERQAQSVSASAAGQLNGRAVRLAGSSDVLAQL